MAICHMWHNHWVFLCLVKGLQEKQEGWWGWAKPVPFVHQFFAQDIFLAVEVLCCPVPRAILLCRIRTPRLYRSPALTPAHACQLSIINAVGVLRGSISTLHTALNALKKIQRKCKVLPLHGSTLSSANSVERGGTPRCQFRAHFRFSELPSGNPSFTLLPA